MSILSTILLVVPISIDVQVVLYSILRFFVGVFGNVYVIGMVLGVEIVGPKYRVTANNLFYYAFVLGEFIALIMGVIFKHYIAYNIAMTVYVCLFVAYFWMVPESPRYLMIKGRRGEACRIFQKIAKSNKRDFDARMVVVENVNLKSSDAIIKRNSVAPISDNNENTKKVIGAQLY